MRILMPVLWFDELEGGWSYFKEEARRLAGQGNSVVIICPHPGGQFRGPEKIKVYRCRSYLMVARAFIIDPLSFLRMMNRLLREVGPIDVVFDETSGLYPMSLALKLWFRFRRKKVPMVVGVHGQIRDLDNRGPLTVLFEAYFNTVTRLVYAAADRVLISGENCRARVRSLGAAPEKVQVMPFGLRDPLPGACDSSAGARAELGIDEKEFVVGSVGRPTRAKGIDTLIKAFARAQIPGSRLLVIGEDGERERMERTAHALGVRAVFTGYRRDVRRLLSAMDVFGNLSLSEGGVSGAQIEAMQAGLPSVVTPFSDEIRNGREALVVGFSDADGAAKALRLLYDDIGLRHRLGSSAGTKAAELVKTYSWDAYLEKMSGLLKAVVAGPESVPQLQD